MKRWFGGSKSYELSADQVSLKGSKDKTGKSTDSKTSSPSEEHAPTASLGSVTISLKETTVESPKRSHTRQKSSGNWKMLLGDSLQPTENQQTLHPNTNEANSGVVDGKQSPVEPVRLPVSSKESRPLSFFQKISTSDETTTSKNTKTSKSQTMEVFPWGERQQPLSTANSAGNTSSGLPDFDSEKSEQKLKQIQFTSQLSRISQSLEDESPIISPRITKLDSTDDQELTSSTNMESSGISSIVEDKHLTDELQGENNDTNEDKAEHEDGVEITKQLSLSINSHNEYFNSNDDDNSLMELSVRERGSLERTVQHSRAIHQLENQHVKRNSDPCSGKRRRKQSADSKRKSFPQTVNDSDLNATQDADMDMKCEILKISAVEAEIAAEKETFVLVDPELEKLGHVRRISLKSYTECSLEESEQVSDTESERYRLAEASGETVVDTASEESVSIAETNTTEVHALKLPESAPAGQCTLRRKSAFKSNTELSSLVGRSFEESYAAGSDRGSLHSFRSTLSNKSYSVNDLTSLERPVGFGTLDMNKLVGSFQMLDSIISEHMVQTRKCIHFNYSTLSFLDT